VLQRRWVALLLAIPAAALAQFTPVKPTLSHQAPTLKPVGTMTVRDIVTTRKLPKIVNAQFQTQFLPYYFLSWKDADRHMEFDVSHVGAAYPKARVCVYAFREAASAYEPPTGLGLTPVNQLQTTDPTAMARLIYERELAGVTKDTHFTIDFNGWVPSGHPNVSTKTILGVRGKREGSGDNPGPISVGAQKPQNRWQLALLSNLVRATGYVRFFVRLEAPGVAPSTSAIVDYGEPQPPNQAKTIVDVQTAKATAEFEELWAKERFIYGSFLYAFRYTTEQSSHKTAMWQMSDKPFPENPVLYKNPEWNIGWGDIKDLAMPAIPIGKPAYFSADIAQLFPEPSNEEKDYYLRVLLFNEDGTLTGPPSNVIKLMLAPAKEKVDVQLTPYLSFNAELVGYKPPCFATSPDYYLLTRTPTSDLDQWKKLTGKQNPGEGDWVYLPPAPPEDKAWYEKVVDAIKWCLGKIQDLAADVNFFEYCLDFTFVQLPTKLANYVASETKLDQVAAASGLDYGFAAAGWVKGSADTMTSVAKSPDYYAANILDAANVPAADWINLRGKVSAGLSKFAQEDRPTNPDISGKLLVPNPDYVQHPPYAYLKVHASQINGGDPVVSSVGTYRLRAMGWYQDPQSPDANKGWQTLYDKTFPVPRMCDGMDMVVPIALDYDPLFYTNPKLWMTRYNQCTTIRWVLDYNEIKTVNGTAGWGL